MSGVPDDDLPEQVRIRRAKLDRIRAEGGDPYPVQVARTHSLADVRAAHADLQTDTRTGERVGVTGRVIFIRNTGKLCFATLREGSSTELQAMLSADRVGPDSLARWKADIDLGDQVFVEGEVITSRRGELSVSVERWALTAKALLPLPVAHKPMSEEARVRQRYVDLIVHPEAGRMLRLRAAVTAALRATLAGDSYLEVETPMLHSVQGGATARPFTTHFNAFDADVYLRIALELHLKRLIVGGVERVYEIGRVLRNEGSDSTHSPEFTMLEAYAAYGDYDTMAVLTQALYRDAAMAGFGTMIVTHPDGEEVDFGSDWPSAGLYDLLSTELGEVISPQTPRATLLRYATAHGLETVPSWPDGKIVEELFEHLCRGPLRGPIFVRDFPQDTSPLTRPHRSRPGMAEKWDLYVRGTEVATAYSELTDPVLQRRLLEAQSRAAAGGDAEAMGVDEDFLRALEYGMPPTGGLGTGIDRILQALTGRGLRETITFPFVRTR